MPRRQLTFVPPVHVYDESGIAGYKGGKGSMDGTRTWAQIREGKAWGMAAFDKLSPAERAEFHYATGGRLS